MIQCFGDSSVGPPGAEQRVKFERHAGGSELGLRFREGRVDRHDVLSEPVAYGFPDLEHQLGQIRPALGIEQFFSKLPISKPKLLVLELIDGGRRAYPRLHQRLFGGEVLFDVLAEEIQSCPERVATLTPAARVKEVVHAGEERLMLFVDFRNSGTEERV